MQYEKPRGIPLYSSKHGQKIKGYLGEYFYFVKVDDDALLLSSNGVKGWVRLPFFSNHPSEAILFSKGIVRLLLGDWRGSREDFSAVLLNKNIPQNLRIDALLYIGLTKEKSGRTGSREFEKAFNINKLEKSTASYLLMSRIADIMRARQGHDREGINLSISKFKETIFRHKGRDAERRNALHK
ncbi:MAG: hypothetical protein GY859_07680 [Desulfobacterales bacterium]|nr:hypothetical protein [Desulfobacterales bacterium]